MNKCVQSELLKFISSIDHGFLTKAWSTEPEKAILDHQIFRMKQVHGNSVFQIKSIEDLKHSKKVEVDISVTHVSNVALTVSTADCVPLLFCDPVQKVIAASHAGWRGTSKDVAGETVAHMVSEYGCHANEIVVAIGPCIHACCYEVDLPVYESIPQKVFFTLVQQKKGSLGHSAELRWMLNLPALNRYQLIRSGLMDENIWISADCTACRKDIFYSYRKEGGSGRQWSYIVLT